MKKLEKKEWTSRKVAVKLEEYIKKLNPDGKGPNTFKQAVLKIFKGKVAAKDELAALLKRWEEDLTTKFSITIAIQLAEQSSKKLTENEWSNKQVAKKLEEYLKQLNSTGKDRNQFKQVVVDVFKGKDAEGALAVLLKRWKNDAVGKKNKKGGVKKTESKDKSSGGMSAVKVLEHLKENNPLDLFINSIVNLFKRKKQEEEEKAECEPVTKGFGGEKPLPPERLLKNVNTAHTELCKLKTLQSDGGKVTLTAAIKAHYQENFKMSHEKGSKTDFKKFEKFEENVWMLISNISELVIYPSLTNDFVEECFKADEKIRAFLEKNKLILCFVLRNILACFCFETVLSRAVYDCLRKHVKGEFKWAEKNKDWKNAVAFVGFNRLMSPNNKAGVSISSDIDFKLVFDPSVIKYGKEDLEDLTDKQVCVPQDLPSWRRSILSRLIL